MQEDLVFETAVENNLDEILGLYKRVIKTTMFPSFVYSPDTKYLGLNSIFLLLNNCESNAIPYTVLPINKSPDSLYYIRFII